MIVPRILLKLYQKSVIHSLERALESPMEAQEKVLSRILRNARSTLFGKKYKFIEIKTSEDYAERMPLMTYKDYKPFIDQILNGQQNVLFPDKVVWWVKSSGTTGKPKLYPISERRIKMDQTASARVFLSYATRREDTYKMLNGKALFFAAPPVTGMIDKIPVGYISGVLAAKQNLILKRFVIPSIDVLNLEDIKTKYLLTLKSVAMNKVTALVGVSPFLISLIRHYYLLDEEIGLPMTFENENFYERAILHAMWKDLMVMIWSGASISPYKRWIQEYIGDIDYAETYTASEGFFGQQIDETEGALLNIDQYHFMFVQEEDLAKPNPRKYLLDEVKKGTTYLMLFSSETGFYSYNIGDLIEFVTLDPPRVKVKGRTGKLINIATEKIPEETINAAIAYASQATDAIIEEYTVCPVIEDSGSFYQFFVEFKKLPKSQTQFVELIDDYLKSVNDVYKLVRESEIIGLPRMVTVLSDTFRRIEYTLIEQRKALGQMKIPHLLLDNVSLRLLTQEMVEE